jgi:K+-transporting ATPase ATPase A chain
MTTAVFLIVLFVALVAAAIPLSAYMVRIYEGRPGRIAGVLRPVERLIYRVMRIDPNREMRWTEYGRALLAFSAVSFLGLYVLQRVQGFLPFNPVNVNGVRPDIAFNTSVSFVTNTNWQSYVPETTVSWLTQAAGLAVQNFVSAAVGACVAVALIRGFTRSGSPTIGNFWADLVRGTLYLLLPLATVVAIILVSQGVVQDLGGVTHAHTLSGGTQTIIHGPAASQEAIKELGTNGGGTYNANSAHPFENPTPFTNWLEIFSLLLIPFSFPFMYGRMLGRWREGVAIFSAMIVLLGSAIAVSLLTETRSTPALRATPLHQPANLEGKEMRFGVPQSAIFSNATTMTSTGAVDSMHDSYTAIGGLMPLNNILLGEVSPGGVGTGLYSILLFAVVAVFIAGLMVGRTPEFVGKTIGSREVKFAVLGTLVMPVGFLIMVGIAVVVKAGLAGPLNPGIHGFSEILYAFASTWNNNGSAFAGLNAATNFYNFLLGTAMLLGRFLVILPALALAGSLAAQRTRPVGPGTMPTDAPIFVGFLVGVILIVGALSFFPAYALGPIAESLTGALS